MDWWSVLAYTLAQPYGAAGAIITWNAPLSSLVMDLPDAGISAVKF